MSYDKKSNLSKVMQTAWMTAYLRSFSDIPYCPEIFLELEKLQKEAGKEMPPTLTKFGFAPQLETRYILVDRLLKESNVKQILELASGLTPRGLNWTLKDNSINYVELEFPGIIELKRVIFDKLIKKLPANLHLEAGDALNFPDIKKSISKYDQTKPVAVINEGLMRYLTFPQKEILANNVHKILTEFGGVWITPDISLKKVIKAEDKIIPDHTKDLSALTNLDLEKNLFESESQAKEFFENLGFTVERHSFLEVSSDLVSPARLDISDDDVNSMNGSAVVFVMKQAKQQRKSFYE